MGNKFFFSENNDSAISLDCVRSANKTRDTLLENGVVKDLYGIALFFKEGMGVSACGNIEDEYWYETMSEREKAWNQLK